MEQTNPATEANVQPIATGEDIEAQLAALKQEQAQLLEEKENYKKAYLKASEKKERVEVDEDMEEKMRRIAAETLTNSRLASIALESDALLQKALKENKELKLAQLNKTAPPVAIGTHSETVAVPDTLVTADQIAFFKKQGKSDKWIEEYKKNLLKKTGR